MADIPCNASRKNEKRSAHTHRAHAPIHSPSLLMLPAALSLLTSCCEVIEYNKNTATKSRNTRHTYALCVHHHAALREERQHRPFSSLCPVFSNGFSETFRHFHPVATILQHSASLFAFSRAHGWIEESFLLNPVLFFAASSPIISRNRTKEHSSLLNNENYRFRPLAQTKDNSAIRVPPVPFFESFLVSLASSVV